MNDPGLSLDHQFAMTAHLHFRTTVCRFNEYGIGEGQPKVLFALREEDGRSQADLARQLKLEPASVTALLGRMEKAGYIRRSTDKQDLRVSRVYLTDAGRSMTETLDRIHDEIGRACFDGFSEEDKEKFAGYLARMRANMEGAMAAWKDGEPR